MKLYTCDACKKEFEEGWSDEEAMEEFKRDYPNYPFMEASRICNDCYKLLQVQCPLRFFKHHPY